MTKATPKQVATDTELQEAKLLSKEKAQFALLPSINAASVIHPYLLNIMGKDIDLGELVDGLRESFKKSKDGDLSGLESMLIGQATALQTMFTSLAIRAQAQQNLRNQEALLSLALKAQAQSRATIQALADLKYPRQVSIVGQANISNGPQQINNQTSSMLRQPVRAKKYQNQQNKLLEDGSNGSTYLDTGAAAEASGSHQEMEAMEAVNRAKKCRRQG